jgi:NAD(P) transhydrogenase subunit beta
LLWLRRAVVAGEAGMLLGIIGTLIRHEIVHYEWIFAASLLGSAIGVPLAYLMPMTAVPQRTALAYAFGALAAAMIGTAEYYRHTPHVCRAMNRSRAHAAKAFSAPRNSRRHS